RRLPGVSQDAGKRPSSGRLEPVAGRGPSRGAALAAVRRWHHAVRLGFCGEQRCHEDHHQSCLLRLLAQDAPRSSRWTRDDRRFDSDAGSRSGGGLHAAALERGLLARPSPHRRTVPPVAQRSAGLVWRRKREARAGLSTPSRRFEKITTDDRIRNNRMTSNEQRAALQRKIWDIANDVRGAVDGWDFKQYVLGTLFYRFISENFTDY